MACEAAMPPPTWSIVSEMMPTRPPRRRTERSRLRPVDRGIALRGTSRCSPLGERREDRARRGRAAAAGSAAGGRKPSTTRCGARSPVASRACRSPAARGGRRDVALHVHVDRDVALAEVVTPWRSAASSRRPGSPCRGGRPRRPGGGRRACAGTHTAAGSARRRGRRRPARARTGRRPAPGRAPGHPASRRRPARRHARAVRAARPPARRATARARASPARPMLACRHARTLAAHG